MYDVLFGSAQLYNLSEANSRHTSPHALFMANMFPVSDTKYTGGCEEWFGKLPPPRLPSLVRLRYFVPVASQTAGQSLDFLSLNRSRSVFFFFFFCPKRINPRTPPPPHSTCSPSLLPFLSNSDCNIKLHVLHSHITVDSDMSEPWFLLVSGTKALCHLRPECFPCMCARALMRVCARAASSFRGSLTVSRSQ